MALFTMLCACCVVGIASSMDVIPCPQNCTCGRPQDNVDEVAIHCTLTEVLSPTAYPDNTSSLHLHFISSPTHGFTAETLSSFTKLRRLKVEGHLGVIHQGAFNNLWGSFDGVSGDIEFWQAQITSFEAGAFRNVSHMSSIRLSSCDVGTIESGAFQDVHDIRTLSVWGSSITEIRPWAFSGLSSVETFEFKSSSISLWNDWSVSGMSHMALFKTWYLDVSCMGTCALAGMTDVVVDLGSSSFPQKPVMQCVAANSSAVVCHPPDYKPPWEPRDEVQDDKMLNMRYTVGFVCSGLLFFLILGVYGGLRQTFGNKNKSQPMSVMGLHLAWRRGPIRVRPREPRTRHGSISPDTPSLTPSTNSLPSLTPCEPPPYSCEVFHLSPPPPYEIIQKENPAGGQEDAPPPYTAEPDTPPHVLHPYVPQTSVTHC